MSPLVLFLSGWLALARAAGIQTTWHWHLQQPIYMPDWSEPPYAPAANRTYQLAYETMQRNTCQENLGSIFGKPDRQAVYQTRVRDALSTVAALPDAGASVSYAADLIRNVNSLGAHGALGYAANWADTYKAAAAAMRTSGGAPRLDLVWFTYHHGLAPLLDADMLRKQLSADQVRRRKTWGAAQTSKGFFPAEMTFSERVIPILAEFGIEWSIVSNNHISRACANYEFSPSGDNNNPPNRAVQLNPAQHNWFKLSVSRGCTPNNAVPFAFTPHRARYVDPATGNATTLVVVPAAQALSWKDGYECFSPAGEFPKLAAHNDPQRPMLVLMAHDGDNAFGGGYSYYMQCVQQFAHQAASMGYNPTTIEQYLQDFPVPANDIVAVEDGAWINKDGDFGSASIQGWAWPLLNKTGGFDIPHGWAMNERNWAVITAGQARVSAAEADSPRALSIEEIESPTAAALPAELAWHFLMPAVTSGYMYYGSVQDMPIKAPVACNIANRFAAKVVKCGVADKTAPTIWAPRRLPHNPGGTGAGALWHYKVTQMPVGFFVWTFADDACDAAPKVTLHVRQSSTPSVTDCNRVYRPSGCTIGAWKPLPMTTRAMPKGNVFDEKGVDFSVLPDEIADEAWVHVTPPCTDCLLDYYIEAIDQSGNAKQTDIFHVWVDNPTKQK